MLIIEETKTKAISTFNVFKHRCQRVLRPADVVGGCGRAMPESGSEPGIVALQDAVHNASPSDTILASSPNGDIQLNGAAENAVRSRRNGAYVENVVEDRLKSVMDIKHVLLPWLVMHA